MIFTLGVEKWDMFDLTAGRYFNQENLSWFSLSEKTEARVIKVNGPVSTVELPTGEIVKLATVTVSQLKGQRS